MCSLYCYTKYIDIEMVEPMYLHIYMGTIVKHHDVLKVEIDAIDATLA